jgi:biotin synthase-related radical SAM superfamily protein
VEEAARIFDRAKAGVHLIAGLGETEQEMIATIQRAHLANCAVSWPR